MCWSGKNEPKIAEKDIKVFKIAVRSGYEKNTIFSYYRGYHYKVGETYREKIRPMRINDNLFRIDRGLHSYSDSCIISSELKPYYFSYQVP